MSTTIQEIKQTLDGRQQRFECELLQQSQTLCIVRHVLQHPRQLHTIALPANTITIAYYWQSRSYNLYHFLSGDEGHAGLAYYFNICDHIQWQSDTLRWRDLTVDILVAPGQKPLILDQEQLPQDLEPNLKIYIDTATQTLLNQYQSIIAETETQSRCWLK